MRTNTSVPILRLLTMCKGPILPHQHSVLIDSYSESASKHFQQGEGAEYCENGATCFTSMSKLSTHTTHLRLVTSPDKP